MAQAKRKSTSKPVANHQQSFRGIGILLVGMVIGSLVTVLWQELQNPNSGVGAGIGQMMKQSKRQDQNTPTDRAEHPQDRPTTQQTTYDFYTVLPEIEVVVPTIESDSSSSTKQTNTPHKTADKTTKASDTASTSGYLLQAGSYKNKADAERLKAKLAFQGLVSVIQKVSIQDRGDFYRVRLGPYASYDDMAKTDQTLVQQGIKALRLKISKGG